MPAWRLESVRIDWATNKRKRNLALGLIFLGEPQTHALWGIQFLEFAQVSLLAE